MIHRFNPTGRVEATKCLLFPLRGEGWGEVRVARFQLFSRLACEAAKQLKPRIPGSGPVSREDRSRSERIVRWTSGVDRACDGESLQP